MSREFANQINIEGPQVFNAADCIYKEQAQMYKGRREAKLRKSSSLDMLENPAYYINEVEK